MPRQMVLMCAECGHDLALPWQTYWRWFIQAITKITANMETKWQQNLGYIQINVYIFGHEMYTLAVGVANNYSVIICIISMQVSSGLLVVGIIVPQVFRSTWMQYSDLSLDAELELIVMSHDQVHRRSDVAAVGLVVSEDPVEEHGQPHSPLRNLPCHDREPRAEVILCKSCSIIQDEWHNMMNTKLGGARRWLTGQCVSVVDAVVAPVARQAYALRSILGWAGHEVRAIFPRWLVGPRALEEGDRHVYMKLSSYIVCEFQTCSWSLKRTSVTVSVCWLIWFATYLGDVVLEVLAECGHVLAIVLGEYSEYYLSVPHLKWRKITDAIYIQVKS